MNVRGKPCLVVGGGAVAERKVGTLLEAGAVVTVLAPQISEGIKKLYEEKKIKRVKRMFKKSDTDAFRLVFACTDAQEANNAIVEDAQKNKALANIADNPERCDFIVPASFHKGSISVAVSTDGKNPSMAALLKKKLEIQILNEHAQLLEMLHTYRGSLKKTFQHEKQRTDFVQSLLENKTFLNLLKTGKHKEAGKYFLMKLNA